MDTVKPAQGCSLRQSLLLHLLGFALLALALSVITALLCSSAAAVIRAGYAPADETYYLTTADGRQLGDGVRIGAGLPLSAGDQRRIAVLEAVQLVMPPLYAVGCILAAVWLFYRRRLKQPLALLAAASEKIAANDLDFHLVWPCGDELGRLTAQFEKMRAALADSFAGMWRQVEARQRLNAAFAHDLRTPLTVLKGYSELLAADGDARTRETAATMARHIDRLTAYADSMGSLQRLEDAQPVCHPLPLRRLLAGLQDSAQTLCAAAGRGLHLQCGSGEAAVCADAGFVRQVGENLLANAARYAKSTVTLGADPQPDGLLVWVGDDGPGFSAAALQRATDPYFTQEQGDTHFGLGLYICRLLCERHGGWLRLENRPDGTRVTAFFAYSAGEGGTAPGGGMG